MRHFRIAVAVALMMIPAAVLSGCRPAERAQVASGARVDSVIVVPGVDTVVTSTAVDTDTLQGGETAAEPEPNDCRYAGERRQARHGEPRYGQRYDSVVMKIGVPFRCRLRPGEPEVKLVVSGEGSIPETVDVHSPADAPRPMQRLLLDNSQGAYEGSGLLVGEDLNGDGWMDLRVFTYSGSGGQMYDVFRYQPSRRRFIPDTVLSPSMNVRRLPGRRCVRTSSKTSASDHSGADYCWRNGAWVMTRAYAQEGLSDTHAIRTMREWRGDGLPAASVDTVPDHTPWDDQDR